MAIITKTTIPTLAARLSKVHVLVVDDDVEILQLLRGILDKLGFEHISAYTDASVPIRMFKNNEFTPPIDLVITDWNMQPVSGLEFMTFLRHSSESPSPYMPIIMLSGYGEWKDVEIARDKGFSEYLVKPFSAKSLCDRIVLCVESPREFVSTDTYKGPSRRRRDGRLPVGVKEDRRKRTATNSIPGKALKSKIGYDINARQIFTREHVGEAQEFIDNAADAFRERAMKDIAELHHTYRNACLVPESEKYINTIKRRAFSLKSRAGIYGYHLASLVAKSLYSVCERPFPNPQSQLTVIEKHIETLRTIFVRDIQGEGDEVASQLLEGLETLILKYKKRK